MIVVTAGTAPFRRFIDAQARQCAEYGYEHRVYDLGGLGLGVKHRVPNTDLAPAFRGTQPPTTFKVGLLPVPGAGETVCWLDGDCVPRMPFEPPGEWDIAVTLRPDAEIRKKTGPITRYLNAGVVWMRDGSGRFLAEWRALCPKINSDQGALNVVVGRGFLPADWMRARGETITTPSGLRARILDAMEWNCWYLPPPATARILHFKADRRHLAAGYL